MTVEQTSAPLPPEARRTPTVRECHGDVFEDPYEWLRDKDSPEVRGFVDGQNAYCEARNKPLAGLRRTLFDELKSRVRETDMSVPVRIDGYWYFTRTQEGRQYAAQCRVPIAGPDDWTPPAVDPSGEPGSLPGEEVVFDANGEADGHDFFRLGGLDVSRDGRWMFYGVDTSGDERYDFRIRDLSTGDDLPDALDGIAGGCLTPDARYAFWVELDDAWRPCAVWRHRVGTSADQDVEVYRESDERFWVGVGLSFDERHVVIGTGSKTTTEVWMLPVDDPEGAFTVFIPREAGVEYDVSFACFEGAGEDGGDIPLAVVYHNALNPNFQIDVIDMRSHRPPYSLGEGVCVAAGSPYGCEPVAGPGRASAAAAGETDPAVGVAGAAGEPDAADGGDVPDCRRGIGEPYDNPRNPSILRGVGGLGIEGIAIHRHYVELSYRADGEPHIAVAPKAQVAADFLAGRPWRFAELTPPPLDGDWDVDGGAGSAGPTGSTVAADGLDDCGAGRLPGETRRLYSIGSGGNPSYDAPRMRYSFSSWTRPGELRELDPATGRDVLLKQARVLGDFDARDYMERRVWVDARDGERIPVSLVWRRGRLEPNGPMFVTGYGAYEISTDPGFSVARLSLLDRGVLYAVPHVRGGGEMGRAWYEQGRRLNKRHTFEDFVDVVAALQDAGLADPRRTVANGGSAGGLLMGAIANLAPDRFAGIEADVPFVDALTTILNPDLPLTVTEWDEWGDPLHDADVYRYMKTYSPYENLPSPSQVPPERFPSIFITTSMNDTRVLVVEPLKWLAALQSRGYDAIARIEVEAGHGGRSGRYKQWEEISYENAWCLSKMGIRS